MTFFSDRPSQVPSSRAALQTRPDRRRKLGDPRAPGVRHPEVWHGPATHTVLHHSAVRGVNTDQRYVLRRRVETWHALQMCAEVHHCHNHNTSASSLSGFGERLLTEVKKLAPKDVKIKVSQAHEAELWLSEGRPLSSHGSLLWCLHTPAAVLVFISWIHFSSHLLEQLFTCEYNWSSVMAGWHIKYRW